MTESLVAFLVGMLLLGVFTRETFVIILIYMGLGAVLLSRWWCAHVLTRLEFKRQFERKVFPDEAVRVKIDLQNHSLLPAVWLRLQDYFPIEVAEQRSFYEVISLGPREKISLHYNLKAQKRGYYPVGPMDLRTGDLLGISGEHSAQGNIEYLTVYPRVYPLSDPVLPSRSPMGTLRNRQPIFEDPSRPVGKRAYMAGDSFRRIDWKASASSGSLQVKIFEPSIALETAIFLNLNLGEYNLKDRISGPELAIVVAASLANWCITKRQSTGLYTNGSDLLNPDVPYPPLLPRKGRAHLMRLLENLARVKCIEAYPLAQLVRQHRSGLAWGTTVILISGSADPYLFDEIIQLKRSGLSVVLVLCGLYTGIREARARANSLGILIYDIPDETAMKGWQL
jgi:uncharacterized protein (DUF58 family)